MLQQQQAERTVVMIWFTFFDISRSVSETMPPHANNEAENRKRPAVVSRIALSRDRTAMFAKVPIICICSLVHMVIETARSATQYKPVAFVRRC
jgi:hypothetical protein